MIAKLFRKLVAAILVLSLVATAVAWTFSLTLLDSANLDKTLRQSGVSAAIVDAIALSVPDTYKVTLRKTITPQIVQNQLSAVVPQVVTHFTTGGEVSVDLRDIGLSLLAAQPGTVAGQLPDLFTKPQKLDFGGADAQITAVADIIQKSRFIAPIVALLSLILLFAVSGHHRFKTLAKSFIAAAVSTAVTACLVWLPVWLSSVLLTVGGSGKLIGPLAKAATLALALVQSRWLLYAAGAYLGVGVIFLIMHPFSQAARKLFGRHGKKGHQK